MHTVFSSYLIKEGGGVLIEPGPAALVPQLQTALQEIGLDSLAYVIPTHIHMDHAGAMGTLAAAFPETKVVVHPRARQHVIDPARLVRSTKQVYGPDFEAVFGEILPVPESQVKTVKDGEVLSLDDRELTIVHTPGHAPHHFSILEAGTGTLFSGEALGLVYQDGIEPLPAAAPPGFVLETYLESMDKLAWLKPERLFFSHDGIGREPVEYIAAVKRNTQLFGQVVEKALHAGEKEAGVIEAARDFLWSRFGARMADPDLAANVSGFIHYYRKKGLA
jgi:glyoxylase-like metal-dependent hydrolase (beta-lactamase superfamily II)